MKVCSDCLLFFNGLSVRRIFCVAAVKVKNDLGGKGRKYGRKEERKGRKEEVIAGSAPENRLVSQGLNWNEGDAPEI